MRIHMMFFMVLFYHANHYFQYQISTDLDQQVNVGLWSTIYKFFLFLHPFYFFPWLVKKFNFPPAFNCNTWQLKLYHQWCVYHSTRKAVL